MSTWQMSVDHLTTQLVGRRSALSMALVDHTRDPLDRYREARRLMAEIDDDRETLAMLEAE